jgi:Tfp pilus assembly protein PilN
LHEVPRPEETQERKKVFENLNLATQPFRNRALPWTVAVVVALFSVVALTFTLSQWNVARAHSLAVEQDVRALRAQSDELKKQAGEINESLTDEQRRMLDAAHLIADRKNFSWSRLFSDLEATLPQGVRVSRITVRDINGSGGQARAELELAVVARNPADVTDMMGKMASSGIFSADLLTQTPAPKGEAGIEATLRVRYEPISRPTRDVRTNDNTAEHDATTVTNEVARASSRTEATR